MRYALIEIERHRQGPRLRVVGARVHHWHVGAALLVLGARLVWRDRFDLLDAALGVR